MICRPRMICRTDKKGHLKGGQKKLSVLGGQVLRWIIHRVRISQFNTFCVELRYDWNGSNKVRLTCLDLPYPRLGFYTLCYEMLKLDVWSMKYDVWCMKNVEWSMEYEVWSLQQCIQPEILENSPFSFDHAAMELYAFCVEPIKVLEVLINQGVVTLNSVF